MKKTKFFRTVRHVIKQNHNMIADFCRRFFRAVRRFFQRHRNTITDFCVKVLSATLASIFTTILLNLMEG